mgnify:FL=1|tara:strand:+ start:3293 stop:3805 length:513 start_codon:yes stop_codon:yes gene_type:complete
MKKKSTKFNGLYVFTGKRFDDKRGFLREIFKEKILNKKLKFTIVSSSKKNVLRGLHYQNNKPQDKFITVIKGRILDVVVDIRKNSKTYGKHFKIELSEFNSKILFVPKGFAHGFLGLEKENIVVYSLSEYRNKKGEKSLLWNDEKLKIKWGIKKPIISSKDKNAELFKNI